MKTFLLKTKQVLVIFALLFISSNLFAYVSTPTYILVSGITSHPSANGTYTKQSGTKGTLKDGVTHLEYWQLETSNGTFYIYADAYQGSDFWNIDNDFYDDNDILNYANRTPIPRTPTDYTSADWAMYRGNKAVVTVGSAPTSIAQNSTEKITFFYNQATNKIYLSGNSGNAKLSIYNMTGKSVISSQIEISEMVDVSTLAAGVYIVKIQTVAGISNHKFIKK